MWGPPGTAKTTIVKASCRAMNAQLIVLSCAGVYSCYVGDAERILREAFHRLFFSIIILLFEILDIFVCWLKLSSELVSPHLAFFFLMKLIQ